MPWDFSHLKWLINTGVVLPTADGGSVPIFEFRHEADDDTLLKWAKHFRNHYCLDTEIDFLRQGYGYTRKDYLTTIKFPDRSVAPGPSIRSGDFAEILAADYLQYLLGLWVPRTRYSDKTVRNESTKGCDVIGFKIVKEGVVSKDDALFIVEAKALLSNISSHHRLQDAVDDSIKDQCRKAESLNAIKQRLFDKGNVKEAIRIERFQNLADAPYRETYGAFAVLETGSHITDTVKSTDTSKHPKKDNLSLLVIHGKDLMNLVHDLYRIAADEA